MSLCFSRAPRAPGFPLAALDSRAQFSLGALSPLMVASGLGFTRSSAGPPRLPFAVPPGWYNPPQGFQSPALSDDDKSSLHSRTPSWTRDHVLLHSGHFYVYVSRGNKPPADAPKLNSLSNLKATPPPLSPLLVRGNFQLFGPEPHVPMFVSRHLY